MKSFLPEFRVSKLLLDSAHDAMPYYEYCKRENITPFSRHSDSYVCFSYPFLIFSNNIYFSKCIASYAGYNHSKFREIIIYTYNVIYSIIYRLLAKVNLFSQFFPF